MHIDIVPVIKIADDGVVRFGIGGAKALHRLIGKHHAPAESIVRAIAFVDLDVGTRQGLFEQNGGIQPRRPAAQTYDALHESTAYTCRCRASAGVDSDSSLATN